MLILNLILKSIIFIHKMLTTIDLSLYFVESNPVIIILYFVRDINCDNYCISSFINQVLFNRKLRYLH